MSSHITVKMALVTFELFETFTVRKIKKIQKINQFSVNNRTRLQGQSRFLSLADYVKLSLI